MIVVYNEHFMVDAVWECFVRPLIRRTDLEYSHY